MKDQSQNKQELSVSSWMSCFVDLQLFFTWFFTSLGKTEMVTEQNWHFIWGMYNDSHMHVQLSLLPYCVVLLIVLVVCNEIDIFFSRWKMPIFVGRLNKLSWLQMLSKAWLNMPANLPEIMHMLYRTFVASSLSHSLIQTKCTYFFAMEK